MADLFDKCNAYSLAKVVMATGVFPYFRPISRLDGTHVFIDGRDLIMVGSNNYLGLTNHPKVKEAAVKALEEYGTSCSGSRLLNGTLDIHEELEENLARFMGKESALVFTTGFLTNQGVIAPLVGRHDTVVIDRGVHASVYEGARLGFGKVKRFRHNDPVSLRRNLERCSPEHGVLVIVDGVYSMEGDIAPIPELVAVAKEFGVRIMVDDAHGIGVLGENGKGVADFFGLTDEIDLIMGTFSKSFASIGGFVAGAEDVIHYVKHNSRALIFSAAMPPASVAAVQAALEVMQTEPEIRERLWENYRFFLDGVQSLGFDTGKTETPIVPLIIGDDVRGLVFWRRLFEEGVFTNCVGVPAVPDGQQRIRTCLMANHSMEDLEQVLEIFGRVGKEIGIIS